MQQSIHNVTQLHVQKTMENLKKNYIDAHFLPSSADLPEWLDANIADGQSVSFGGSETLYETGTIDYLRARDGIRLIDRDEPGLSREQVEHRMRQAFTSDCFLCSSNAITYDGRLYNVDGNGNRVSAMIYGPKSVIIIAGVNKLVPDMNAARQRLETISAPANTVRLNKATPCAKTGICMHCTSPDRICCSFVELAQQRVPWRIKVVLVGESLGF